ncbi:hypothetical protein FOZ60_016283 [Perkinsus olseni]|uniref:Uncharacterized protein n=1 Tax=Perkinsus olseni TaxID=32597 RepID=A0A7J6P6R6_PEROL|nr:hypothetical protein FOZ60_016283 [Perkinsus olseni]
MSAVAPGVGEGSSSKAPSGRWCQTIPAYESLGFVELGKSTWSAEGLDVRTEEAVDTFKLGVAPVDMLTEVMSMTEQRPGFFGPTTSPEGGEGPVGL